MVRSICFVGRLIACTLMVAAGSAAHPETVRVDEWLSVRVDGKVLVDKAPVIRGTAYLPLRATGEALGVNVEHNPNARAVLIDAYLARRIAQLQDQLAAAARKGEEGQTEVERLRQQVNELTAERDQLRQANATLAQTNERLQGEIQRLLSLVETARYFGFRAKQVGRSIETPGGESRAVTDYWGIVTCWGEDLFVFLPTRGGPKDASGIQNAQRTAEMLNGIVTGERELKPVWFVTNVTEISHELAVAYHREGSSDYRTLCSVSRAYADIVLKWLKAEEASGRIPKDKRLQNADEAAQLVRGWWLALLRDHVCIIQGVDPRTIAGTTTESPDSAEIFLNVMQPRLAANPKGPDEVGYPPLQILDIVGRLSPEEKLTSYGIHHEEGLLRYLLDCWQPRR